MTTILVVTFWSLNIGICDLFVICLPAVILAGCLEFVILDTKLQGTAIYLCFGPEDQVFKVRLTLVLDPLQFEYDGSQSVGAAGDGHALFLHPRVITAVQGMKDISLYVDVCPVAKIRRAIMAVHHELLTQLEPLAFRGDPVLVYGSRRVVSVQIVHVHLLDYRNFYLGHLNLL